MDPLEQVYASGMPDKKNAFVYAIRVLIPNREPVRFCNGYRDRMLGENGVSHHYVAGSLEIALPAKNTSGQQNLRFAVPNIDGTIRKYIGDAMASGEVVRMVYTEYRAGDLMTPSSEPIDMEVKGASIEGIMAIFQGSYKDLLNLAFGDANRYTAETAPGLKFSS